MTFYHEIDSLILTQTIEIAGQRRQGRPLSLRRHQDLEEQRVALQLRLQLQLLLLAEGPEGGETALKLVGGAKVVERFARAPLNIIANLNF